MNTLPLSKSYRVAYYGLLAAFAGLTGYGCYLGVFQYLQIRDGGLRMRHTCYTDSSLAEAGYWCCFCCLLVVSAVGLWLRKRWAYFLFHVFGVPAVLLCLVYLGNALTGDIGAGWADWSCALVMICAVIYFLNSASISQNLAAKESFNFGQALYFCTTTFTTVGYGDFSPLGGLRLITSIEAFLGIFGMGFLVAGYASKKY